jgi:hypothetical protein
VKIGGFFYFKPKRGFSPQITPISADFFEDEIHHEGREGHEEKRVSRDEAGK